MFSPSKHKPQAPNGRASVVNPVNRFEKMHIDINESFAEFGTPASVRTEYYIDNSKEILAKNDSPDVTFTYSINPYRGCEHGCIYCYARPTHEYFGLSSGLDFETKIFVKKTAPELLRKRFSSKKWIPQFIAFSGNTDCYQPIERQLKITRECLKVFLERRNPVGLITKNALILRDIDLLQELSKWNLVCVTISITTLNPELSRRMEPRASSPQKRLDTLKKLAQAGIPIIVSVAPIIPGLTEHELPKILKAAADCGVKNAAYIMLRLPYSVKELMQTWLKANYPNQENRTLNAIKTTRNGTLNNHQFGMRMSGEGPRAETIKQMFRLSCQRYGLSIEPLEVETQHFRRLQSGQLTLEF